MSLVSFDERLGFATMTGKAYVGGKVSLIYYRLYTIRCLIIINVCSLSIFMFVYRSQYQSKSSPLPLLGHRVNC